MTEPVSERRTDTPLTADEVTSLVGFLEYQRDTLMWKCSGLTAEGLVQRLSHPTRMTLGGLLKHLARVEDYWFGCVVAEGPTLAPWDTTEWAAEWESAGADSPEELMGLWRSRVAHSREVLARALAAGPAALDTTYPAWEGQGRCSLRWVLLHMIEEYARHNGHADLLREAVDGETGE